MPENNDQYFVGIKFRGSDKSYYFSTDFGDLKRGDLVVVRTVSGFEMGSVCTAVMNRSVYHSSLELKPILRKPTEKDMEDHKANLAEEKKVLEIVKSEIDSLGLPMNLIEAVFSLDGSKVTITYTSPEQRVDFRELLRNLGPYFSCRIELRQIASRDKAKMIGGIGICGLPLCCSTFLSEFEGISIGKAKNQMLTLNIPKLSGPCGKLICCLNYEDDLYTEAKRHFPRPGTIVHTPEGEYSVDSFNILSKNVKLVNAARDDWKTYPLEDVEAMMKGTYKKKEEVLFKEEEASLPTFDIPGTSTPVSEHPQKQEQRKDRDNRFQNRKHNKHFDRRNQQGQSQDGNQRKEGEKPHYNHHHRHHYRGNKPHGNGGENKKS